MKRMLAVAVHAFYIIIIFTIILSAGDVTPNNDIPTFEFSKLLTGKSFHFFDIFIFIIYTWYICYCIFFKKIKNRDRLINLFIEDREKAINLVNTSCQKEFSTREEKIEAAVKMMTKK